MNQRKSIWPLALGALGIVYGDIGTSPLYALRECFEAQHGLALSEANVLGILSLVVWSLVLIISVKYMIFVMKADNRGEGGILALLALATTGIPEAKKFRRYLLVPLGIFGASLLYGDGVITPAISVLSAVEGLKVATPVFQPFVIPITLLVLIVLFVFQYHGTARIGGVFGPIICMWFLSIAALGINGICIRPDVLVAMNPWYGLSFLMAHGWQGFLVLGSVFLVVTGGEALYADMGHFGRRPIRLAWFVLVFPCLLLNYFGQGALLLTKPEAITNPFFLLAPDWAVLPMVVLATAATVIASQALISGVYSLTHQAILLGYCPRLAITHTSQREMGQIYIPVINWALLVGVIFLVINFKNSSALAGAYGVAVTTTMVATTLLAGLVAVRIWKWQMWVSIVVFGFFAIIDFTFLTTNIHKIPDGGWVPLCIGFAIYMLMSTWKKGRRILSDKLNATSISYDEFLGQIKAHPPVRVPGTAVFMSAQPTVAPIPLVHNLRHNKVLHERVVILTIGTKEIPFVAPGKKVTIEVLAPDFFKVLVQVGFMENPSIRNILSLLSEKGLSLIEDDVTFVLGIETILATGRMGMSLWRERLFAFIARNAQRPTAFFRIPPNQVIEVGIQVEI